MGVDVGGVGVDEGALGIGALGIGDAIGTGGQRGRCRRLRVLVDPSGDAAPTEGESAPTEGELPSTEGGTRGCGRRRAGRVAT